MPPDKNDTPDTQAINHEFNRKTPSIEIQRFHKPYVPSRPAVMPLIRDERFNIKQESNEYPGKEVIPFLTNSPVLRTSDIPRTVELFEIHKRFLNEILPNTDLILFTGSVRDSAEGPLFLLAQNDTFKNALNNKPETNICEWRSVHYFENPDTGPNSIVYKAFDVNVINIALRNVEYARSIEQLRNEFIDDFIDHETGEPDIQKIEQYLSTAFGAITDPESNFKDYLNDFKTQYRLIACLQHIDQTTLNDVLKIFDSDGASKIDLYLFYANKYLTTAESIYTNFQDELPNLDHDLKDIQKRVLSGEYKHSSTSGLLNEPIPTVYIPTGQRRVSVMKAVYPECILQLYSEYPKNPHRIAFYDNYIDTGIKISAYNEFFQALGIDSQVQYYAVYSNPYHSKPPSFPKSNKLHIGKVFKFSENPEDVPVYGREHDKESRIPNLPAIDDISANDDFRREYIKWIYSETSAIPHALQRARDIFKKFPYAEKNIQAHRLFYIQQNLSNLASTGFPQILVPTTEILGTLNPEIFEKALEIKSQEKIFFSKINDYLAEIDQQLAANPEELVITNDYEIYFAMQALIQTGTYENLPPDSVIYHNGAKNSEFSQRLKGCTRINYISDYWPFRYDIPDAPVNVGVTITCIKDDRKPITTQERKQNLSSYNINTAITFFSKESETESSEDTLDPDKYKPVLSRINLYTEDQVENIVNFLYSQISPDDNARSFDLKTYFNKIKNLSFAEILEHQINEEDLRFFTILNTVENTLRSKCKVIAEAYSWNPDFDNTPIDEVRRDYVENQIPKRESVDPLLHELIEFGSLNIWLSKNSYNLTYAQMYAEYLIKGRVNQEEALASEFSDRYVAASGVIGDVDVRYHVPYMYSRLDIYWPEQAPEIEVIQCFRETEKARYLAELAVKLRQVDASSIE